MTTRTTTDLTIDNESICCNPWNFGNSSSSSSGGGVGGVQHEQRKISALAEEMNALSVQERDRVYEDLHGVADIIKETPTMVASHIEEMKQHLQKKISKRKRKDFDRALFLRPSLETDTSFYLMFLRAKRFDTQEAAECMCAYFTNKVTLFGENLIVEKITLQHLSEAEFRHIRSGSYQILKQRENTGKAISVGTVARWDLSDWKSFSRYMWYSLVNAVEEDEQMQKQGYVAILNAYGSYSPSEVVSYVRKVKELSKHWPVYLNGMHICHNAVFLSKFSAFVPKQMRLRVRSHCGSPMEAAHTLMTFGINAYDCLLEEDLGIHSPDFLEEFIKSRHKIETTLRKEKAEKEGIIILHPRPNDILMGRGWFHHVKDWPGNMILNKVVTINAPQFNALHSSNRHLRSKIVSDIIDTVFAEHGSRFLERNKDGNGWTEVDTASAQKKVSQAIRLAVRYGFN